MLCPHLHALIGAAFFQSHFSPHLLTHLSTRSYVTMIDAGSSGCRAHVFRYGVLGTPEGPVYVLPKHDSKKVKPGLSSFEHDPVSAGISLTGLVEFMKTQIPVEKWSVTPIYLKATAGKEFTKAKCIRVISSVIALSCAQYHVSVSFSHHFSPSLCFLFKTDGAGLRMLPTETSDLIVQSVQEFLGNPNNSPFFFEAKQAGIISGNEEVGSVLFIVSIEVFGVYRGLICVYKW